MSYLDNLERLTTDLVDNAKLLKDLEEELKILESSAIKYAKSWSGSCLGYHSCVYYKEFISPPIGHRFSQEWGLMDPYSRNETIGEWTEYEYEYVINAIKTNASISNIDIFWKQSREVKLFIESTQASIRSILTIELERHPNDSFLLDLLQRINKISISGKSNYIKHFLPARQTFSRDMSAIAKGAQTPPHIDVLATICAIRDPFIACETLGNYAKQAFSHISRRLESTLECCSNGSKIFIGHGRSLAWLELKDFVKDRLCLPWDEFNRVPVAGMTNISRLSQMLDTAAFAFIIMTAEDVQKDGRLHARMNVLHEAGLFQGRLGFERAIIVLEEGCEEFSNIQGLGQIRFPKGNISAVFENIRNVLERENIIKNK